MTETDRSASAETDAEVWQGTVAADMSMSLDGFIAGANDGPENPLGDGGERLHEWVYDLESWRERHGHTGGETNRDAELLEESFESTGAVVMGRRMFDNGEGPWGDDPPFGVPVFVLTHHERDPLEMDGGTTFHFVTDGIERALERAKAAAGDKDVAIAGGANTVQQYVAAGLLDEIWIHLVPVLLGDGIRLFESGDTEQTELETVEVRESSDVTHLQFRVAK